MAKTHSTTKRLIPAAGYLRRSSGKQEKSIPDQKRDIEAYAVTHGYRIVRWYVDDAVSGDETEKRVAFLEMHRDACNGRRFRVILCWDQDRFGRFNSMEAGYYVHPLMKAGVRLESVTEGPLPWDDFTGRVIYGIKQEAKHQFLIDLAKRISRGQKSNAKSGGWNGGPIPFGFERGEYDGHGNLLRRLQDGERKRAGCRVRLVPVQDETRLEAVRYAFARFVEADVSIRQLASELDRRGYPSPSGDGWRHGAVGKMLANPVYCGTSRWANRSPGKYASVGGTITCVGAYAGIVPPEVFVKAQKRLAKAGRRRHARRAEYPLRDLIFCEHCGQPMQGVSKTRPGRNGRGAYHYSQYICSEYRKDKHLRKSDCGHFTVHADRVLRWLVTALQRVFLHGPGREALVSEIARQLEATAEASPDGTTRLQDRLKELDGRITRLRKAIAQIDDTGLVEQLRQAKTDRDRVAEELAQAGRFVTPQDIDREARRIAGETWRLAEDLGLADPATLREVFQQLVSRIVCRWEMEEKGGRKRCRLAEGRVELRPHPLLECLSSGVAQAPAWVRTFGKLCFER